jgi:hypothetical protein
MVEQIFGAIFCGPWAIFSQKYLVTLATYVTTQFFKNKQFFVQFQSLE